MSEPGVVAAAGPLLVRLDSSDTAVPALTLGSYSPVVGDRVSVDKQGSQLVVLGTTATAVGGPPVDSTPVGRVVMQAGSQVDAGYLLCNGASVLRASYPALAAYWAASTPAFPYGAVDGTHMTLPNFPQGVFPTGGTPGVTGGAATHSHPLSAAGQAAVTIGAGDPNVFIRRVLTNFTATHSNAFATSVSASTAVHNSGAELVGDTDAASTVPPFLAVSFQIKVA